MSVLERGPEPPAWVGKLAELYRRLQKISEEQKSLIETSAEAEAFAERFGELASEWNNVQTAIMELEDRLRREIGPEAFYRFCESEIQPLARQILATMVQAEERIRHGLDKAGGSILSFQNYRHLRQAYAEYEDQHGYFFDEKK